MIIMMYFSYFSYLSYDVFCIEASLEETESMYICE